ncbi:phage virion morphogenesis protein [Pseudomonas aeruginosa]|uniref:phage virion morphogenesis protein n=1 Tax=Pseudomonas aeruginosa TaxID=287 RepID=UPI000BB855B1|nr:phage virion morphogenesis protein [Pseudomonas aeruginosa]AXR09994.1 phage virion morphogenesis protein [Pseudomonas aeruginosa]EIU2598533.1 phage virion morphogenesis protein [Pseudomonas aeruginosa]EIU2879833.1 phage virion morphogenesis protein [Pseudomonas aeruginosa]ELC7283650.1 phage virion morphogenesis protein [Pseudomonas aeruginosa]ELK4865874.1 phage virion morphogenesis protein [Pseudomonas aeruginosa]
MAGAMITVDLGTEAACAALEQLAAYLDNLTTPLQDVSEYLQLSTDARFRAQVGPDGTPWAPLSPTTLARKKGNRILRESGLLQDTLRGQVEGNELHFGTDRPYGAVHQFGQPKGKSGTTPRGAPIPWGDIPARPYLGLSAEDEVEIPMILHDYLAEPFEG